MPFLTTRLPRFKMESTKSKMNMHFETIANNQSCNAVLRARIAQGQNCTPRGHTTTNLPPPFSPLDVHPHPPHLASPQIPHLAPSPLPAPTALKTTPLPAPTALKPTRPDSPPLASRRPQDAIRKDATSAVTIELHYATERETKKPRHQDAHGENALANHTLPSKEHLARPGPGEQEKTGRAKKTQKVIAQVKCVTPGLMARDYGFFSTQTSLV
jgi:hypothetical protein